MAIEIHNAPARVGVRKLEVPRLSGSQVRRRDRMVFTERLELLLETGHPLHVSLETLSKQQTPGPMGEVAMTLYQKVSSGRSFADALREQPEAFPASYVELAAAGERGGFLPDVLERIRVMEGKLDELRSAVLGAFAYPAFLAVFSAGVILFVLTTVYPRFTQLFEPIQDELMFTTRALMATSELVRNWWPLLLAGAAGVGIAGWRWARGPRGSELLDRLAGRTPVLRDLLNELNLVRFLRVMSISLERGVPLIDALRSSREVVQSVHFRRFIDLLDHNVKEGGRLSVSFTQASFLPELARQMVATGDETGNLASVMGRVADFYEQQWARKLGVVSRLVEPAMLLLMGAAVGIVVSSLILPIFKLSQAVH